jgi:hypothetical protein
MFRMATLIAYFDVAKVIVLQSRIIIHSSIKVSEYIKFLIISNEVITP